MVRFIPKIRRDDDFRRQQQEYNAMLRAEARIGGQLFGPIPAGHQRDFFCLDEHTWVWHEQWLGSDGKPQSVTTRYEVRPTGVLKIQNNQSYQAISHSEAKNLLRAAYLYVERVKQYYQSAAA